jgi:two-component system phosphate regulon sensor histidine kinase PhoR
MLYAAVAARAQGKLLAVVRVARALPGIDQQAADLRRSVLVALLLAFGITALLVPLLAHSLAGPLREIMDAARRFAGGDLSARSRVSRRDEVGELARIVNQSADALQRRLVEIARDRARIEAILSAMEDGVLAVDARGVVLLANDRLKRSLRVEEPEGRHYMEAVRHPEVERALEGVLRTGQRVEVEVELPGRAWALTATPFPGEEGRPGAVVTFHDVTERRRLERVRRDFVANASHELRTPLTSIRGFWRTAPSTRPARGGASWARSARTPSAWASWWPTCWNCRAWRRASGRRSGSASRPARWPKTRWPRSRSWPARARWRWRTATRARRWWRPTGSACGA